MHLTLRLNSNPLFDHIHSRTSLPLVSAEVSKHSPVVCVSHAAFHAAIPPAPSCSLIPQPVIRVQAHVTLRHFRLQLFRPRCAGRSCLQTRRFPGSDRMTRLASVFNNRMAASGW